jgi:uncharacterized membrane-anchored protein
MALNKFRPQSPDPELAKATRTGRGGDATLARLAHLNKIVDALTLTEYANNAAAVAAGLEAGDFYHVSGVVMVVV